MKRIVRHSASGRVGRIFRVIAWLLLAIVAMATLLPIEGRPVTGAPAGLERFAAFALIGAAFQLGYPRRYVGLVLFVVGLAGAMEMAQNVIPDRHGNLHDYAVKASGAILGAIVAGLARRIAAPRA